MHSNTTIQDYRLSEHERQYKQARLSDTLQRGALRGRRGMRQTVISTLMHAVVALLQPSLKCGKLCLEHQFPLHPVCSQPNTWGAPLFSLCTPCASNTRGAPLFAIHCGLPCLSVSRVSNHIVRGKV